MADIHIYRFCDQLVPVPLRSQLRCRGLDQQYSPYTSCPSAIDGRGKVHSCLLLFLPLVNLCGNVPLLKAIDPTLSMIHFHTLQKPTSAPQIVADLKKTKALHKEGPLDGRFHKYNNGQEERVRPTKWAACALLARTYLYLKDWPNAITEASLVIDHNSMFQLSSLNETFLKNSSEAIWQLQPVAYGANTIGGPAFILPSAGVGQNNPL